MLSYLNSQNWSVLYTYALEIVCGAAEVQNDRSTFIEITFCIRYIVVDCDVRCKTGNALDLESDIH